MTPTPIRLALRRSLRDIRYIRPVRPRDAGGLVGRVYGQLEREFGLLAPPVALHSPAPKTLAAAWLMLRESLVGAGAASRADKELVATAVSTMNACPYCVEVHGIALASLGRADAVARLGVDEPIADPASAALADWVRGARSEPPTGRSKTELAELVGVAVAFHYLNRMVNIFLGPSPLPATVPDAARQRVRGLLGHFLRPRGTPEPGASLDLLPDAPAPPDLAWARHADPVLAAFARATTTIDAVPPSILPDSVRQLVLAELTGWDGAPRGLSTAWVAPLLTGLAAPDRPAARLALLTAFASAQVDASAITGFRANDPSDQALVELTGWASLAAARTLGPGCRCRPRLEPVESQVAEREKTQGHGLAHS